MAILGELLSKVEKSEKDDQIKQICDQIMAEERPKFIFKNFEREPVGSNIFLAIEVYNDKLYINYVCLEREQKELYIVSLWSQRKGTSENKMKRRKVWEVPAELDKPEKILKFYAEKLKFVRGE